MTLSGVAGRQGARSLTAKALNCASPVGPMGGPSPECSGRPRDRDPELSELQGLPGRRNTLLCPLSQAEPPNSRFFLEAAVRFSHARSVSTPLGSHATQA